MIYSYQYGDIVIASLTFTDQSDTKKRPVLILAQEGDDYVIAFITSQTKEKNDMHYNLPIDNENNLRADSTIRLQKIMTLHETLLGNKLGCITAKQKAEIKKMYTQYFGAL